MELEAGETLIKQGQAGLLRGLDRLEGTLTLTSHRLVFEGPVGVPGASSEVLLELVEAAGPARVTVMGVPLAKTALGVSFTNGLDARFAVGDRTAWVDAISDAARHTRKRSQTSPAEAAKRLVEAVEAGPFQAVVDAQRELIEFGQEAAPVLVDLLGHQDWEVRTHAAGAVSAVHADVEPLARALAEALSAASEEEEIDTLLIAIQQAKVQLGIPAIATLIRSEDSDDENASLAIEVLGALTGQDFEGGELDAHDAALEFLDSAGY